MRTFIQDKNLRGYLFEMTEARIRNFKIKYLLGLKDLEVKAEPLFAMHIAKPMKARSDFQSGDFKCNAEYIARDTWRISMWGVQSNGENIRY